MLNYIINEMSQLKTVLFSFLFKTCTWNKGLSDFLINIAQHLTAIADAASNYLNLGGD